MGKGEGGGLRRDRLTSTQRCIATVRGGPRKGERCQNPKMVGLKVCRKHGGGSDYSQVKSEEVKREMRVAKAVSRLAPIKEDDPDADPMHSFLTEFRKTVARCRYLAERIARIADTDEDALTWGKTKEVSTDTSGDGADATAKSEVTYEATLPTLLAWETQERKHLLEMQKVWISAKLDVRRLEIEQSVVDKLDGAIMAIVIGLGRDVRDPEVRNVVRMALVQVADTGKTLAS